MNQTNPELNGLPDVGKTKSPNYEYIMQLSPDLILFKGNQKSADILAEKTGIPVACVLSLNGYDFNLYTFLGKLLGKEEQAAKIVGMLESKKSALEELVANLDDADKKSAYIVLQNSSNVLTKTQKNSQSMELSGMVNVAKDASNADEWGTAEISKEEILRWNIDYIFLDKPTSESSISKTLVKGDPTFQFLSAVKDDKIFYTHTFSLPKDYVYVIAEAYYYANTAYPHIVTDKIYASAINDMFEIGYGLKNYYEDWKKSLN